MVHVDWFSEHVTLCLAARPPFYNAANTFLLALSTLTWHKLQIPDGKATLLPNLRHHCGVFYRFRWFSDEVLIARSSNVLFDEDANRSIIHRWYRAHVRSVWISNNFELFFRCPSSLLELAWLRTVRSNRLESNNLKTMQSLLQL